MGKLIVDGQEMASLLTEATLDAADEATASLAFLGDANLTISGTFVGEIVLEKSFDGGAVWVPATNLGVVVVFSVPASEPVRNREGGVLHRLRMRARTSGAALCRLSQ